MAFEWNDFNFLFDLLVQYYFGTYAILSLFLLVVVMFILLMNGISLKFSILLIFPLLGFFVSIGWFGNVINNQWIVNIALIVIAIIYAYIIIKLMG